MLRHTVYVYTQWLKKSCKEESLIPNTNYLINSPPIKFLDCSFSSSFVDKFILHERTCFNKMILCYSYSKVPESKIVSRIRNGVTSIQILITLVGHYKTKQTPPPAPLQVNLHVITAKTQMFQANFKHVFQELICKLVVRKKRSDKKNDLSTV